MLLCNHDFCCDKSGHFAEVIDKIVEDVGQFNGRKIYKFLEVYKRESKWNCILEAKGYLLWIHSVKNIGFRTRMHFRSKRLFSLWNYRLFILAMSFDILTISLLVSRVFFLRTVSRLVSGNHHLCFCWQGNHPQATTTKINFKRNLQMNQTTKRDLLLNHAKTWPCFNLFITRIKKQ